MCACVGMLTSICLYIGVCVEAKGQHWVSSFASILFFYNRMVHRTWHLLLQLEWLASELQGSSYVHLRHYDDKCVLPFLAHVGAAD